MKNGNSERKNNQRVLAVQNALKNHSAFSKGEPFDAAIPNVTASIMGKIARETAKENAGDSIDRGLKLLRKLNEAGLNVSFNSERK